jgi:hypothetical protein
MTTGFNMNLEIFPADPADLRRKTVVKDKCGKIVDLKYLKSILFQKIEILFNKIICDYLRYLREIIPSPQSRQNFTNR